jgi:hypothetical protein
MRRPHFKLPPEVLALADDPRAANLADRRPPLPPDFCVLEPLDPPKIGESPFLILDFSSDDDFVSNIFWAGSAPPYGAGIDFFAENQPRLFTEIPRAAVLPGGWFSCELIVASPPLGAVLREYASADIAEGPEIELTCADGKIDGYRFIEVRRFQAAYDWQRSAVIVERDAGGNRIRGLGLKRALKRDLDPSMKVFRESYAQSEVFVSRELATAIRQAGLDDVVFYEPATMARTEGRLGHPYLTE